MPDLFVRFGGHKYAAGVTLEVDRVDEFRERFRAYAASRLKAEDLLPELAIDGVLALRDVNDRSFEEVMALAPFGNGNPQPVFAALDVEVAGPPAALGEKHLRVCVKQDRRSLSLKAWNFAERAAELAAGARVDVAFTLEEDARSAARGYPGWAPVLRQVRPAEQWREAHA